MIILLPHLYLTDYGMEQAATRFNDAFQQTWERLPTSAESDINNYLGQKPGKVYLCYKMDYNNLPIEPFGRSIWFDDRTVFTFLAPFIIHATPLEAIIRIIAHELAHCYHKGAGTWTPDEEEEEVNARINAVAWGFPEPGFDKAIWLPEIEAWRKRHEVDLGHLTEALQVLG